MRRWRQKNLQDGAKATTKQKKIVLGGMWLELCEFSDLPAPTRQELASWIVHADLVHGTGKRFMYIGSGTGGKEKLYAFSRPGGYEKLKRHVNEGYDVSAEMQASFHLEMGLQQDATMANDRAPDEMLAESMNASAGEDAPWRGSNHASPLRQGVQFDSPVRRRFEDNEGFPVNKMSSDSERFWKIRDNFKAELEQAIEEVRASNLVSKRLEKRDAGGHVLSTQNGATLEGMLITTPNPPNPISTATRQTPRRLSSPSSLAAHTSRPSQSNAAGSRRGQSHATQEDSSSSTGEATIPANTNETRVDVKETSVVANKTRVDGNETRVDGNETEANADDTKADAKETKVDAKETRVDTIEQTPQILYGQ
ncbi:hypothetical protein PRZ48_007546 [Zasmidium cellare]|uniref:Uncharacterized protein n=1 Tax=Zasmidium cellare TaxID=395010 RepID=A0ABR0EJL7_ZASCE|nr:hypothetical protein PRZ48_007546 [Zasmidium cellare]